MYIYKEYLAFSGVGAMLFLMIEIHWFSVVFFASVASHHVRMRGGVILTERTSFLYSTIAEGSPGRLTSSSK